MMTMNGQILNGQWKSHGTSRNRVKEAMIKWRPETRMRGNTYRSSAWSCYKFVYGDHLIFRPWVIHVTGTRLRNPLGPSLGNVGYALWESIWSGSQGLLGFRSNINIQK